MRCCLRRENITHHLGGRHIPNQVRTYNYKRKTPLHYTTHDYLPRYLIPYPLLLFNHSYSSPSKPSTTKKHYSPLSPTTQLNSISTEQPIHIHCYAIHPSMQTKPYHKEKKRDTNTPSYYLNQKNQTTSYSPLIHYLPTLLTKTP